MYEYKLNQFLKVAKSSIKASKLLGKTVEKLNEDALLEVKDILMKHDKVITIGIKNTGQINKKYIKRLIDKGKYVWHTIDFMSEGGRAVDDRLINPLTLRPMTGSSSATALNVLYGVNDIGIGTDGGGSVLAPALSLNLCSIMAKGMGLKGSIDRVSTDGIKFVPGIGVISHSFELAKESIFAMLDVKEKVIRFENIKVCICKKGEITLPDGKDMREKLDLVLSKLMDMKITIGEEEFPDFENRENSIERMNEIFKAYDMVITCEGPIDILGLGDSVFGTLGSFAKSVQNKSGKYMVKIANMLNATSITLPINEVASGIVITSKEGLEEGMAAISVAENLKDIYSLPDLYYRYFKESYSRENKDIIFSL